MGAIGRFEAEFLARRGTRPLHRSIEITKAGVVFGAGTVLAPMRRAGDGAQKLDLSGEDRILALLAAVFERPIDPIFLGKLQRAAELWTRGEKSLAHIHLARLRLPKIESEEQAFRLFLADGLMAAGFSPRALCKALGFDLPEGLKKYSPDQPRDSDGRWTNGAGGGGAEAAPASTPAAPGRPSASSRVSIGEAATAGAGVAEATILGSISAEALAGLASVAAGFAGATAAYGLIFIPSPNGAPTSQGAVPGEPGLNYSVNHDEGLLRITRAGSAGDEIVVATHLGQGGVFRDETGAPIARAVSGSVVIDPDAVRAAAAAKEKQENAAGLKTGAEAQTEAQREEPKLCPAPVSDKAGGRKAFDIQYEQYVRSLVNPQRQPPLPTGLAFSLTNPSTGGPVLFDDCRESDGAMIEAKGHYAEMMRPDWEQGLKILADKWTAQAKSQVGASGGREIDWYFHEQAAADFAQDLFSKADSLGRIKVHYLPDPDGIPNPNLRIK